MLIHEKGICYQLFPNWQNWERPTLSCISTITSSSYRVVGAERHEENYMAFQYTLSGCGRFFDGRNLHQLPPGRGFLIPITDPAYVYYYPPEATAPWRIICFCATGETLLERVRELNRQLGYIYDLPLDDELIQRLVRSCQSNFPTVPMSVPEANQLLTSFFNRLIVSHEVQKDSTSKIAQKAYALMVEHLQQPLDLRALAGMLLVSREHLIRCFHRYYGQSPYAYFSALRNKRAEFLLTHTQQTVKEIAEQLGFNSSTVFINHFRRYCGLTPAQYRNRKQKMSQIID